MKSAGSDLATITPKAQRDWGAIRAEYEAAGRPCSLRYLARRENIPLTTMFQRSRREGWIKHQTIVKKAFRNLSATVNEQAQVIVEDQLAPWIEKEKVKFTRLGVVTAKRGVKRVAKYQRDNPDKFDARNEANMAKAFESYHRAGRTALGLSDGSAPTGIMNFQMLSNKTAIQISSPDSVERS